MQNVKRQKHISRGGQMHIIMYNQISMIPLAHKFNCKYVNVLFGQIFDIHMLRWPFLFAVCLVDARVDANGRSHFT